MEKRINKFVSDEIIWLPKIFLALFVLTFTLVSFNLFLQKSLPLVNKKPLPNSYRSDEFVFLRTFYLIREGENYYHAFNDSVQNDIRKGNLTKDIFAWRLPTIFYLWAILLKSGFGIGILFILLSSSALVAVYFLAEKFFPKPITLLSPILLAPYFLDAYEYKTSFLFTEWWGLFFYIFGLTLFFYKKNIPAFFFLTLAILTRELFLIPILMITITLLSLRKNPSFFLKILLVFTLFYSVHFLIIQNQDVPQVFRNPLSRIHLFSYQEFQKEIAFSMRQYPFLNFRLPLVFVLSTTLGIFYHLLKNKKENFLLLASAILPLTFLTPFFGVTDNDYWGIVFMPIVISFSPLILLTIKDLFTKTNKIVIPKILQFVTFLINFRYITG